MIRYVTLIMYYTCHKHPDAFIPPERQHRRGVKHMRLDSRIKYILQMGHYLLKEPANKPQASVILMHTYYKETKQMSL